MKNSLLLFYISGSIILSAFYSCNNQNKINEDELLKKEVLEVSEKYAMEQFADPQISRSSDAIITVGNDEKRYVIDQSNIFTGFIDEDPRKDAIISVAVFEGQYQTISEQLILLNIENRLQIIKAIESDMRIISLKDRIITADVPEHSRNTPLFNCKACWEVVKYRYNSGDLVKVE